jgi:hypothetical protein
MYVWICNEPSEFVKCWEFGTYRQQVNIDLPQSLRVNNFWINMTTICIEMNYLFYVCVVNVVGYAFVVEIVAPYCWELDICLFPIFSGSKICDAYFEY